MYRVGYSYENHPEAGYGHTYYVKEVARVYRRKGKRHLEWVAVGPCDVSGVLDRDFVKSMENAGFSIRR